MVKSEPKKKPQFGGFFQKFFRKPERNEKEQRLTVQRSIPYLEMGRDGICRVEEHLYSKTVRFYDINYQLAQNEDKNTIFESWCDFLNYFDASIRFQLSFINHKSDMSEYNKVIQIEPQHDAFDDVRMEYAQMLKQQLAKGNNGLVRTKYITFSIEAKSVREAKPRLERIETDILNNFKVLGVKAYPLNGVERLQIMYETFHQEEQQKFDFSYDRILQSGMTTKDFISPTSFLFKSGKMSCITEPLQKMGIPYQVFSDVQSDPTLACAKEGAELMRSFQPDVIIALGGGSAMDAAKIMWVLYEHPDADFADMAMRFLDIRKRTYEFPEMGEKAYFIAVPTSSGTGSEVTPFAVITDEATGAKYPLADYQLLPNMAIIDTDLMMSQPRGLTAASGIDAMVHALEAYASVMATDFTDGLALKALKNIFTYLPECYENGEHAPVAREKMANASTMAGMAFANAFLGVCHSMAHKLGAFHHLPHGVANALLITDIMRYNIADAPQKMGTFSQYPYPNALPRYCECARFVGVNGNTDEEVFENFLVKIEELKARVGIKKTIRDYGVTEEAFLATLDDMCEQALDRKSVV